MLGQGKPWFESHCLIGCDASTAAACEAAARWFLSTRTTVKLISIVQPVGVCVSVCGCRHVSVCECQQESHTQQQQGSTFFPSGLIMNIQLSFFTISSRLASSASASSSSSLPAFIPQFIPSANHPLVFLSHFALHPTHLFVLIWKMELEVLAMFCPQLCGIQ